MIFEHHLKRLNIVAKISRSIFILSNYRLYLITVSYVICVKLFRNYMKNDLEE